MSHQVHQALAVAVAAVHLDLVAVRHLGVAALVLDQVAVVAAHLDLALVAVQAISLEIQLL